MQGVRASSFNYNPALESASPNELPDYGGTTGVIRPVGAFRESQYDGAEIDEPLIN
jgi:hypothetical protein